MRSAAATHALSGSPPLTPPALTSRLPTNPTRALAQIRHISAKQGYGPAVGGCAGGGAGGGGGGGGGGGAGGAGGGDDASAAAATMAGAGAAAPA